MSILEKEAPRRSNPNFVRPGDPSRSLQNKNFVSREAGQLRAISVETQTGIAVRRPDETEGAYKKRSKQMAKEAGRQRAVMAPNIAYRELVSLEKKWADRIPSEEKDEHGATEIEKFAPEFEYMNDCRFILGWPEVDYTKPRDRGATSASQEKFVAFARKPARERLHLCRESEEIGVMTLAAVHDQSPDVRAAAEERMQLLWAQKSAAK